MVVNCSCPNCHSVLAVPEEHLGKEGRCNKCGNHVRLTDTRIPCPWCKAPVFFPQKEEGMRAECVKCLSTVVLTTKPGFFKSKLVPMTQEELDRIEAEKEQRKKEALQRAEREREAALQRAEQEREEKRVREEELARQANEPIRCPACHSTQVAPVTKGFSVGKAVLGGVLLGPLGLVGGAIGSKKIQVACMKCGRRWDAGG